MTQLLTAFLLLAVHFLTGYGVLNLLKVKLQAVMHGSLSLLLGIAVASLLPFFLQLAYIPLTTATVFGTLIIVMLLVNVKVLLSKHKPVISKKDFSLKVYEIPFVALITFLVLISIWRSYILPPTPRDLLSGPEAIAEFAVREHTFINSIFNLSLESTNNQFKPPFITCLQLIYKLAGFPFGQWWLGAIVASFIIFLYNALKRTVHPILAGALVFLFMAAPELYGYTFMVLFDYSNMVFFFLSCYFLFEYFRDKEVRNFYLSTLLMAFAVYIRSETLVLAAMMVPAVLFVQWKWKTGIKQMAITAGIFIVAAFLFYWIPQSLYIKHYLPANYDMGALIRKDLFDLAPLWKRFGDMTSQLMYGEFGKLLWGYIMYVFLIFLVAELVITKAKLSVVARNWLYAVLVVYVGLPILGFVLPLMDLEHTTKRGLMKILPLMLLYLANNKLLVVVSDWLRKYEFGGAKDTGGVARPQPRPTDSKKAKHSSR
ncbi:hypothetical protein MKQ68_13295 [Chitinophaga horti]|uniref:Glycosyltransferase RgtA/B/C/D-like domain-containing protein n=1 Tax=Chitinophaga horti TaxID=2920382 RepID=A0ABY6IUL7_9BACT|nr:hypothetical protein [Chitinophaga horti]UYQ91068.1 hypothetical protein MKQ68_13295 [Chitinophaga horti]